MNVEPNDPAVLALELVLAQEPRLLSARGGQPLIIIPGRDPFPHLIRSDRVQEWVAQRYWTEYRCILRDDQIRRVLTVLAGIAAENPQGRPFDRGLWGIVDKEPALLAVQEFMARHDGTRHECPSSDFYRTLTELAEKLGMHTTGRSWPKGAAKLTAILNDHESTLRELGIEFDSKHTKKCSQVTLSRLPDSSAHARDNPASSPGGAKHERHQSDPAVRLAEESVEEKDLFQRLQQIKETHNAAHPN